MKKKWIVFMLFLLLGYCSMDVSASTGHKQFRSLEFIEDGLLLVDLDSDQIIAAYKHVDKRRFWGWNVHYFQIDKEANYVGEDIFGRSNRTSVNMDFEYTLREVAVKEKSLSVGGNLSIKTKGKVKGFDVGLDAIIKADTTSKETATQTQDTKWKMTLKPYTKVSLRTVGVASVTNGVSAYYVLGMRLKRGLFEQIEVITWYYELFEETLS